MEQELITAIDLNEEDRAAATDMDRREKAYADFIVRLEKEHPNYFQLRYGESSITLAEIRKRLLTDDRDLLALGVASDPGVGVPPGVVGVQPAEPGRIRVEFPEGGVGHVELIEVLDHALQAVMSPQVADPPFQAGGLVELGALAELAPHEQQLLAGEGPHVGVERPQRGELAPRVLRDLVDHGALAVHDLVMAQRQDEVLGECVEEAEGKVVVVVAAIDRIFLHVAERVVHPPHVPLEAEAEPAAVGRVRNAAERG